MYTNSNRHRMTKTKLDRFIRVLLILSMNWAPRRSTHHMVLLNHIGINPLIIILSLSSFGKWMQMLLEKLPIKVIEAIVQQNIGNGFRFLVNDILNGVVLVFFFRLKIGLAANALVILVMCPINSLKDCS